MTSMLRLPMRNRQSPEIVPNDFRSLNDIYEGLTGVQPINKLFIASQGLAEQSKARVVWGKKFDQFLGIRSIHPELM